MWHSADPSWPTRSRTCPSVHTSCWSTSTVSRPLTFSLERMILEVIASPLQTTLASSSSRSWISQVSCALAVDQKVTPQSQGKTTCRRILRCRQASWRKPSAKRKHPCEIYIHRLLPQSKNRRLLSLRFIPIDSAAMAASLSLLYENALSLYFCTMLCHTLSEFPGNSGNIMSRSSRWLPSSEAISDLQCQ